MIGWVADLLAQAAPSTGGDWVQTLLTATGPAGAVAAVLWKVHTDHVKRSSAREADLRAENKSLTSRLFLLADRATEVGQTAAEVVRNDANDPELLAEMQRLVALIEERSR